jgi:hypothetical protein
MVLEWMVGVVVDLEGQEFLDTVRDRRRRLFDKVRPRR